MSVEEITAGLTWSGENAVAAAEERIRRCRQRRHELRDKRPFDVSRIEQARESLEAARARYAAAESRRRLRAVLVIDLAASRSGTDGSPATDAAPGAEPLTSRMVQHAVSFGALFDTYFSLGGNSSAFEVDGYLHDVMPLPTTERKLLEHALWELTELPDE